ncbi:MAG: septum formation initiator family protein [Roseivivax sp.]|nr:septum formation initiator family protein [Roseivivax sp.]
MTQSQRSRPAFAALAFVALSMCLGIYFTFAAVQGDYGLFRRAEVQQQASELRLELAQVQAEVTRMENLTRRLSDDYLDLDLLDEQAREILGRLRTDEIVLP